ncbi:hypothetical protein CBP52_02440 [Cellulomonas sp. PSBB021]|nr:Lsr2 family protein [Cellulomonas sp. PSBB021]ASR54190.1 hypothetical protein CBP52_02440 [Cellulomonas sp. PSBB021]
MAQRVVTHLVDDLTGGEATRTVLFSFDGKSFEIDLNDENLAALEGALAPYIAAGRRTGGSTARPAARRSRGSGPGTAAHVRVWAKANGYDVPERGRIPATVRAAYDKAN